MYWSILVILNLLQRSAAVMSSTVGESKFNASVLANQVALKVSWLMVMEKHQTAISFKCCL